MNNLSDYDLSIDLRIDGEHIKKTYLRARECGRILGIYKSPTSVLPFKFQELELVGTFRGDSLRFRRPRVVSSFSFALPPHHRKTRTRKMLPSCPKWGRSNFEPFAPAPCAR